MRTIRLIPGPQLAGWAQQVADLSAAVSIDRIGQTDLAWLPGEIEAIVEADERDVAKQWWLITEAGQVVGAVELEADLTTEGPCDVEFWVHPAADPAVVLAVQFELADQFARNHTRTDLICWYLHAPASEQLTSPVGIGEVGRDAMAEALLASGVKLAQVYRISAIDPRTAADPAPVPEGYRLVSWLGPTPPELRHQVARSHQITSEDAPTGETGFVAEEWTPDRVAADEATWVAAGRQFVTVLALSASGELAGFTRQAAVGHDATIAWQWDTSVVPAHRGHGLGVVLKTKATALLYQTYPQVRQVITHNAAENVHMLRINVELGWTPIAHRGAWTRSVPVTGRAR